MTWNSRATREARGTIAWRVTFVDSVSSRRIDVDVRARDVASARERGWAALRAARPPGVVAVELVDARPDDDVGRARKGER